MRLLTVCAAVLAAGCSVLTEAVPSEPSGDSAVADSGQDAPPSSYGDAWGAETGPTDAGGVDSGEGTTGGPSGAGGQSGQGGSGGTGGDGGQAGGAGGIGPVCECDTVNDCCDGCDLTHVCDGVRTEPQCQAAACDDAFGCSVTPAREMLPCDDGDPDTRNDSCHSGACVGDRRECSSGPCCDGWNFLSDAVRCAQAAPPSTVVNGVVVSHEGGRVFSCYSDECRGRVREDPVDIYCSGQSAECNGRHGEPTGQWSRWPMNCGSSMRCAAGAEVTGTSAASSFAPLCIPAPDC